MNPNRMTRSGVKQHSAIRMVPVTALRNGPLPLYGSLASATPQEDRRAVTTTTHTIVCSTTRFGIDINTIDADAGRAKKSVCYCVLRARNLDFLNRRLDVSIFYDLSDQFDGRLMIRTSFEVQNFNMPHPEYLHCEFKPRTLDMLSV